MAEGGTKGEAAKAAGVSPQSISYWLKNLEFYNATVGLRSTILNIVVDELNPFIPKAIKRLGELLQSGNGNVAIRACCAILDYGIKGYELTAQQSQIDDLKAQIEALTNVNSQPAIGGPQPAVPEDQGETADQAEPEPADSRPADGQRKHAG